MKRRRKTIMPKILTREEIDQKVEEYRRKLIKEHEPIQILDEDHITVSIKYLDREDRMIHIKEYFVENIWSAVYALTSFFRTMNKENKDFLFISYKLSKESKGDMPIDIWAKSDRYKYDPTPIDLRKEKPEDDEDEN